MKIARILVAGLAVAGRSAQAAAQSQDKDSDPAGRSGFEICE